MATKFLCKILCYLLSEYVYRYAESRLMVSPSGVARVCPGGELAITCSTDRSFIQWNIMASQSFPLLGVPYRTRLISASQAVVDPLVLNMVTFDFSHSLLMNGSSVSLVSVLSVTDVPDILNGTIVNCTDVGSSLVETNTEIVTVHIIQIADLDSLPEVETEVLSIGADNITVSLSWTQQESSMMMSYNVTVVPEASAVKFIEGFESTAVQLILSYNIQYIVIFVGTLCGRNMSSTTVELNYVKCTDLLQMLGSGIQVIGYSDPAIEGTTVILECPSPNLVHMGPNTTTCMGNGEWEPDPRDVQCIESAADCGVPLTNGSVNVAYNSTLEGSVAVVLCDGFEVEAFCHRNGSWSPQLNDNVCSVAPMKTVAASTSILITTTSVVVPIVVLSILGLLITLCICLCHKYKPLSSKASPDGKTRPSDTHVESSQPTQPLPGPVYETITECNTTPTTVDLEMTENMAYAPIHTFSRQT